MKALVVVAHDDDIPLWIGGTVMRMSDWDWSGVAMCWRRYARTDEHKAHFEQSCRAHGVKPAICDFQDYQQDKQLNKIEEMAQHLLEAAAGETYDYVFTHSRHPRCEYGFHANHVETRKCVELLVSRGHLVRSGTGLAYFSYQPIYGGGGLPTVAATPADAPAAVYLQLTYEELVRKLEWVMSFAERFNCIRADLQNLGYPCPNPEAFEGDALGLPSPFVAHP